MLLLPEQTVAPPSPNSEAAVVKNSSAPLLPNHFEDSSEALCPALGASLQTSKKPFTSVLAAGAQVKCQVLPPGRALVLPARGVHSLLWDGNAIVGYYWDGNAIVGNAIVSILELVQEETLHMTTHGRN